MERQSNKKGIKQKSALPSIAQKFLMGPARNMLQAAVDNWVKQGYRECRILIINYLLLSLFPNQVSDIRIQNHPRIFSPHYSLLSDHCRTLRLYIDMVLFYFSVSKTESLSLSKIYKSRSATKTPTSLSHLAILRTVSTVRLGPHKESR